MFSQRVKQVMEHRQLLVASPTTCVSEAARQMAGNEVGAVVVVESGAVVGIFTERDAVVRVLAAGRDAPATRLAEVMTPSPRTVGPEQSFGHALQLMHAHGFRHMPVVEGGRLVGIVTARDALDPDMEEFVCEVQRREGLR